MATTNALLEILPREPRMSPWARFKRAVLEWVEESPVIQALCCLDGNELELNRMDRTVRACVREEMRMHLGYHAGEDCVTEAISEVYRHNGYDLANVEVVQENKGAARGLVVYDPAFAAWQRKRGRQARRVKVAPKFAAACVLHIRCKLGVLSPTEANVLLVQRKYLEVCRKHGVRDGDTIAHQQHVLNSFFTQSVLDDVGLVRRKLPRWVLALQGSEAPGASAGPC